MRPPIIIVLSFFLATAIMAPAIITISGMDNVNGFVLDLGEEEEKKEVVEKDFLFSYEPYFPSAFCITDSAMSSFYLERNYCFLKTIVLPPPESIS
ncbi:hypothetical protein FGM00_18795 [Aggregatimonas sangjinii]|uniref:Uncharacterized protein n=1 Tax=Aggregatimonas sangjinii TaxID=2583587 RepID=A0A5B7SYQ3_9FLAO|nr:hypothetical protein [Aggregatimonas sangjinii]QCX02061.1 hypothetical protein FGM00_18795 [Aggregatimonas sangjinii]